MNDEQKFVFNAMTVICAMVVGMVLIICLTYLDVHKSAFENGYVQTMVQGSKRVIWVKEKKETVNEIKVDSLNR